MRPARELIAEAADLLAAAGVPSPRADAELLLSHVLGISRGALILAEVPAEAQARFADLLAQRAQRRPLQHLTGLAHFRFLELDVGPGVFVPRPETESVAGIAIAELAAGDIAVDLCTGSGAIAIALATEADGVEVHAVELSEDAFAWARRNADRHSAAIEARGSRLVLHHGDATALPDQEPWLGLRGRVAVVISNPPYIPDAAVPRDPEVRDHDPHIALFGGPDGLDVVRGIVGTARTLLRPGGLLVIEHAEVQGIGSSEPTVAVVLAESAEGTWTEISTGEDLAGRPRWTQARLRAVAG